MSNKGQKRPDNIERNKRIFIGKSSWNKGLKGATKHTEEQKKKFSEYAKAHGFGKWMEGRKGELNNRWKGGTESTLARYRKLLAPRPKPEQCEVCGSIGQICLDHDHITNNFRGWLCFRCNIILGHVKDNAETLIALAEYLKKSKQP